MFEIIIYYIYFTIFLIKNTISYLFLNKNKNSYIILQN